MLHEMNLVNTAFNKILSGKKTIELRLFDEKRQEINIGDNVRFRNTENGNIIVAEVKALHIFKSFEELYKALPLDNCGYEDTKTAKPDDMLEYYTAEQIEKYGVVGIEIKNIQVITDVISHYDTLIDQDNDPVHDPKPLQDYMDKWDGQSFIDNMELDENKSVLEIGVGTGRLALRVAPYCKEFCGIDISPKTIERAKDNLSSCGNVSLICGDFISHNFSGKHFDVIYSSLTFMHIPDKQSAIEKIKRLLCDSGIFVLSIDKNQLEFIDMGIYKVTVFPDTPETIHSCCESAKLRIIKQYETEFANVFVISK